MFALWKQETDQERQVVGPGASPRVIQLVVKAPTCEFCLDRSEYFGKTERGRTSYMCAHHFRRLGDCQTAERLVVM